jgi:hypothetical protein
MKDLFFMGGSLFMSILTVLLIIMTAWILYHFFFALNSQTVNRENALRKLQYGKSIGLFALIIGISGQLIGFYSAFSAIERASDISPVLVYGGIKVSLIPTLYGISIYLISLLLWFITSIIIEKRKE